MKRQMAFRDADGNPIPGVPDGEYELSNIEWVEDGDTVQCSFTATCYPPVVDAVWWVDEP